MGSLPGHALVEDFQGILKVYSDGSTFRSQNIDFTNIFPPHNHHDNKDDVSWKDRRFDKTHDLSLRLYKPNSKPVQKQLLPIVVFFHGGGFCVGSRTWPNCHNCCLRLCSALPALVVSPDYRLAPEHRLPAAVEDAMAALRWVRTTGSDEWLDEMEVDFGNVFIVGDSSGGNIAHQLAIRLKEGSLEMNPIRVRGYVLFAPFFGGTVKTKSEAEGPPEELLTIDILDRFWSLSLPKGCTQDHPMANPFGQVVSTTYLEKVPLDPILVIVGGCELLKDRVENYAKRLEKIDKCIEYHEFEGKQHGFFTNYPYSDVSTKVLQLLRNFISRHSGN